MSLRCCNVADDAGLVNVAIREQRGEADGESDRNGVGLRERKGQDSVQLQKAAEAVTRQRRISAKDKLRRKAEEDRAPGVCTRRVGGNEVIVSDVRGLESCGPTLV